MALNFSTTDVQARTHGIKVLVYGRAGMGKTHLCGTAPSPLIISAEAGLLTLKAKKIPVILVTSVQDVWDAYTWCATKAKANGIQTICLDSISEIAEKVLSNEKKKTKDPRAAYGELGTQTIDLVKGFRDLVGFNVVVTAKEATKTDSLGVVKAEPTSPGQQIGQALPYLFDEVFHAAKGLDNTGKEYHYLRTRASISSEGKDRSGALDEIEYPDLAHIFGKIAAHTGQPA